MTSSDFSVLLPWSEDESRQPTLGDGVSRPRPSESTRLFRVEVRTVGAKPMRWIAPAPSSADALTYARNRWPHADVRLVP